MKEKIVHTLVKGKSVQTVRLDETTGTATCGLTAECDRNKCDLRIKHKTAACVAFVLDDAGRNPKCHNG